MNSAKTDIREQVIDTASSIFKKFGFKKTTMDEIAIAMHKGKSSIYYYFKSKEDIFEAVVEKEINALRKEIQTATSTTSDPKEQLRLYIITRMNAMKRLLNLYEAIKNDYLAHLDFINSIREKYDENETKSIVAILQTGVDNNEFYMEDLHLTATSILTAMRGLELPILWDNKNVEKRTECLISILFSGILKR